MALKGTCGTCKGEGCAVCGGWGFVEVKTFMGLEPRTAAGMEADNLAACIGSMLGTLGHLMEYGMGSATPDGIYMAGVAERAIKDINERLAK